MMNLQQLDVLFNKIYQGGLTAKEQEDIASTLSRTSDPDVQQRAMHVLGWSRSIVHAPLIASFLRRPDQSHLHALALRALVRWLDDAAPYTDILKCFLAGIPEDPDRNLQLSTLEIAGDAYRQTKDAELIRAILGFLEDDPVFRESARDSLVTALVPDWETLPPRERDALRRGADVDDLVTRARRMIRDGGDPPANR